MKYPPYPKYKKSGIDWIGDIPDSWTIDRIKVSVKSCNNGIWGDEAVGDDNDTICVRVADFKRDNLSVDISNPTLRNVSVKERSTRTLKKGDLLLEKSGGGENQPVGCVVLYGHDVPAVCSNFIAKMSLKEGMNPSFWKYLHSAAYSIRLTIGSINQTSGIQNLDQDRYFNEKVPFPPPEEQKQISIFLDRETAKIDELIQKYEKMIGLLTEKKRALINNVMTKGFDTRAEMRNSGVEWLGSIPTHWTLSKIKFIKSKIKNSFVDGPFGSNLKSEHFIVDGDVFVIESNFATQGKLNEEDLKTISSEHFDTINRSETLPGDIIISKIGANFGRSQILPKLSKKAVVSGNSLKLTVNQKIVTTKWVNYFLSYLKENDQINLLVNGSAQPALSLGSMNELIILVPPLKEQENIISTLDDVNNNIDMLINKSKSSISLMKERRSSLVSAAVTGKIDARELV